MPKNSNAVADAIRDSLRGYDHPSEPQTITEAVGYLRNSLNKIANAISADAAPGQDAAGGYVSSLTEATMGVTAGLFEIAHAISDLADAVRNKE